jgi:hypothetical protein
MGFGKHRSREVRWVVENDPSYIGWIFTHAAGSAAVRSEAEEILAEGRDCPECGQSLTRVIWGLPGSSLQGDPTRQVEFGGCVVPIDPAVWKCAACERGFKRDLTEGDLDPLATTRHRS